MSSFDLFDFNGSVKKNPYQDAVMRTLNERDRFLQQLEEKRRNRAIETKQGTAAVRIQKSWRRYHARQEILSELRGEFDVQAPSSSTDVEQIRKQMSRLILFYSTRNTEDGSRLVSLCSTTVALSRNLKTTDFISDSLRLLFSHRILQFLSKADRNTVFTLPLRFLETFLVVDDYEKLLKQGYFEAFLNLIVNASPDVDSIIIENSLPPRANILCEHLLLPVNKCSNEENRLRCLCNLFTAVFNHNRGNVMASLVIPFLERNCENKYSRACFYEAIKRSEPSCATCSEQDSQGPSVLLKSFTSARQLASIREDSSEELTRSVLSLISAGIVPSLKNPRRHERRRQDSVGEKMEVELSNGVDMKLAGFLSSYVENMLSSSEFLTLCRLVASYSDVDFSGLMSFESRLSHSSIVMILCQSDGFFTRLFSYISGMKPNGKPLFGKSSDATYIDQLKSGWSLPEEGRKNFIPSFSLFCSMICVMMETTLDEDFLPGGRCESNLPALITAAKELRDVTLGLIDLAFPEDFASSRQMAEERKKEAAEWSTLYDRVVNTLQIVHRKDYRVKFLPDGFWVDHNRQVVVNRTTWQRRMPKANGRRANRAMSNRPFAFVRYLRNAQAQQESQDENNDSDSEPEFQDELPPSSSDMRNLSIIRSIPFVVPFQYRLRIFQELISHDKEIHGVEEYGGFAFGPRGLVISVRRPHIYDDAFISLSPGQAPNLRIPIRVTMSSWAGAEEIGQDGGGIFREFLSELLKTAFDPNKGLFRYSHDRLLYPNPTSASIYGSDYSQHYYFLGRMVAKLIYEGMMMDMRFADFFLVQLLGNRVKNIDINQMKSYDPIIYKHLRGLLTCSAEELACLGLDFSVIVDNMGQNKTVELKPNGRNIVVTTENRVEYVQLYVNYFLLKRIEPLVDAMRSGVSDVIEPSWLAMFDPSELQMIVSGVDAEIDVDDMKANCLIYNTKDEADERYMTMFWSVVKSFPREDKAAFLKFVTGCSRPPIDGFVSLMPQMGIQLVREKDLLPMSATCMNLFKLPLYKSREELDYKLKYAINSGAGFELQ